MGLIWKGSFWSKEFPIGAGGNFKYLLFSIFSPKIGGRWTYFDTYFSKGVGSTTNYWVVVSNILNLFGEGFQFDSYFSKGVGSTTKYIVFWFVSSLMEIHPLANLFFDRSGYISMREYVWASWGRLCVGCFCWSVPGSLKLTEHSPCKTGHPKKGKLLLMEEIPNNHLGCIKPF